MPKFKVKTPLDHDGEAFKVGSVIELTKAQAEPLVAVKAVTATEKESTTFTQEQIREAIWSLDVGDESLFTANGVPTTEAIADVLGGNITAKERNEAWAVINQE